MRRPLFALLVAAMFFLTGPSALSQCMVTDSLIKIYPYFGKGDSMVYFRESMVLKVVGEDTTVTRHIKEKYQVVCKKADDKKGYLLEETILAAEDLSKDYSDDEKDPKQELSDALLQATIGMKTGFHMDPYGQDLKVEESQKVVADLEHRIDIAWNNFSSQYPVFGAIMSKETLTGLYKNLLATPELVLNNFEEIVQLFYMHGNVYDYEVPQTIPMDSPQYTRPGEVQYIAMDVPDEGSPKQNYDDYKLIVRGETYQDAVVASSAKLSETYGREISPSQVRDFLGDKTPTGEITLKEYMENEYFYDGWPKEMSYITETTSDEGTNIEIKYIVWEERHVKRK